MPPSLFSYMAFPIENLRLFICVRYISPDVIPLEYHNTFTRTLKLYPLSNCAPTTLFIYCVFHKCEVSICARYISPRVITLKYYNTFIQTLKLYPLSHCVHTNVFVCSVSYRKPTVFSYAKKQDAETHVN